MQPAEPLLQSLATEQSNPASEALDTLSTLDIVALMNQEDCKVPAAVATQLPQITQAVDAIVARLERGSRLFYVGAGTSGRLGILDAAECVPTFDTPPELVQGVIAGGAPAMTRPVEGAEDDTRTGRAVIVEHGISAGDVVTGLSASGRAPYVLACLDAAREVGAFTIGVCCTEHSAMEGRCDVLIAPVVGPEVLTGSTRLKAGTAQKLVLNMLSTASMVRLGKCYGNLMVDVQATNFKLRDRAARIVATVTRQPYALAWAALDRAGFRTKVAIVMIAKNIEADEAEQRLAVARGQLRRVLESKT